MSTRQKKYSIMIVAFFFSIMMTAGSVELTLASKKTLPLYPVFIKTVFPENHKPEIPIAMRFHGGKCVSEDFKIVELRKFRYANKKISEHWFLILLSDKIAGQKVSFVLPITGNKVELTVLPIQECFRQDYLIYKKLDEKMELSLLLAAFLNQDDRISIYSNIKSLEKLAGNNSCYGYIAKFILGCLEFNTTFKKHNIIGPIGAYKSSYQPLESVIEKKRKSPIQLEALRRLSMAKAWSSAYDDAERLIKELRDNKLSQAYSDIARPPLYKGLKRIIEARAKIDMVSSKK